MRNQIHSACSLQTVGILAACFGVFAVHTASAQIVGGADVNTSQMANYQNECAIITNPLNKLQLFSACNNSGPGLFASRSIDGGATWIYPDPADRTIADGDAGQGPAACCDPTLAWDNFGNLFITYLGNSGTIETLLSTDGGATFTNLATFGPASVDQPTVAVGAGQVWIVWNQSGQMVARGAAVTGPGTVGTFNALQTIPGTTDCSFGDIAISPGGAVCQTCQTPTAGEGPGTILVNTDLDGLGPGNFAAAVTATTTNVGGFDFIPIQNVRSVDAEAGLAYDRYPESLHFGRLYLVYTEEVVNESNNTDIMVRFSDDNGLTWSASIRVNDDPALPIRSQFLPRISSNPLSGNIAVCWHDCRNSATNNAMQLFATMATPTGAVPAFFANTQIGDAQSTGTGSSPPAAGTLDIQFGDYAGLTYFQGAVNSIWADNSNSTGDNPDAARFDAYTERFTGGVAANEGDPHMTTINGINYDFQSAGEFVSLRGDGLEIQIRQTAISTNFFPGPNPHTGLATCVSINTAVAARVGIHRISYQPTIKGVPDPSGLQLRVDGVLTTLGMNGIDLGSGGRIVKSSIGNGIEIDFPNGTTLIVTPGWWADQSKWYLNVNAYHTTATEGTMGVLAKGSWLPALPNGTSLGPRPAALPDRYVDINEKFADAWRVTDSTSLFDYAPGTSTATFTIDNWPKQNPPCVIPQEKPAKPLTLKVAEQYCSEITGKKRNANCVFDVMATGEPGFAKTYLLTQRIEAGATATTVHGGKDSTRYGETVEFNAAVTRKALRGQGAPVGFVQFVIDGRKVGEPVKLNSNGRATWKVARLEVGKHRVTASYIPVRGSQFLSSTSAAEPHTVVRQNN